jgi:hypothetical protein
MVRRRAKSVLKISERRKGRLVPCPWVARRKLRYRREARETEEERVECDEWEREQ